MKSLYFLLFLFFYINNNVGAQSKTTAAERKENPLRVLTHKELPDLAFMLPPALTGAGDGFEYFTRNGVYAANVPIQYAIGNLGKATSKPIVMYAQLEFKLLRSSWARPLPDTIELFNSHMFGVEYLKPGVSKIINKTIDFSGLPFMGSSTVRCDYSKVIKLRLFIVKDGYGSQKEVYVDNNVSADVLIHFEN